MVDLFCDCDEIEVGDYVWCFYRQRECEVVRLRNGWPIVQAPGTKGGGTGLLVNGHLLLSLFLRSSQRVQVAYEVDKSTVRLWRRAVEAIRRKEENQLRGIRRAELLL